MKYSLTLLFTLAILIWSNLSQATLIRSTFDNGIEGFGRFGTATTSQPIFNAAGFITLVDGGPDGVGFLGSSAFLGNLSGAFGQVFSYDLNITGSGTILTTNTLFSFFNGSNFISFVGDVPPRGSFESIAVTLDSSSNFFNASGNFATDFDIRSVLANVTRLEISADFILGTDTVSLDNVSLSLVPEPPTLVIILSALLFCIARSIRQSTFRSEPKLSL